MKTQKITMKGGKEKEKARKEAGRDDGRRERERAGREEGERKERLILHSPLHLTPVAPALSSHLSALTPGVSGSRSL